MYYYSTVYSYFPHLPTCRRYFSNPSFQGFETGKLEFPKICMDTLSESYRFLSHIGIVNPTDFTSNKSFSIPCGNQLHLLQQCATPQATSKADHETCNHNLCFHSLECRAATAICLGFFNIILAMVTDDVATDLKRRSRTGIQLCRNVGFITVGDSTQGGSHIGHCS